MLDPTPSYYAVKKGHSSGIFVSEEDLDKQVKNYPDAEYEVFKDIDKAVDYLTDQRPKKYYAVKEGHTSGIFLSVNECNKQTEGCRRAKSQVCDSLSEAMLFIFTHNGWMPSPRREIPEYSSYKHFDPSNCITIYVDGSYNSKSKKYGYGVLIDYGNGCKEVLFGNDYCMEGGRNVEGEVAGAVAALNKIRYSGNRKLVAVYYDYEGIGSWADKRWKTNRRYTTAYAKLVDECRWSGLELCFFHVQSHTGVEGNEYVDKIAKLSCGIELTESEYKELAKIKHIPGMPRTSELDKIVG